ncbi:hypothetical protein BDN70DRAFT_883437 [Pholiota conissans]|uniref:Uncharacterized protein n=1 Tax=Pholiota conissans TaxID=109636 RepID=A0A9P5YXC3_9AGAR|nr:hypothetical protein BDN70DRAFT_883437 [Pholiota conissans]
MTSPAISDQATKNNQRLFKRYAQIFQDTDIPTFVGHAQKFSLWLSDHKAYYISARPEIIKLLLVAQGTLRRALHIPEDLSVPFNVNDYPDHPLIPPYMLLVQSILPFESMFSEPSLIAHIRTLRESITPHYRNHGAAIHPQSSLSLSGDSAGRSFDPDVQVVAHQMPFAPGVSGNKFSDLDIQIIDKVSPQLPQQATMQEISSSFYDPDIQIIENPNPHLSASHNIQKVAPSLTASPTSTTAPVKRVKKRKTLNLEALAQTDVQKLLPMKNMVLQPHKGLATELSPSGLQFQPALPFSDSPQNSTELYLIPSICPGNASEVQLVDDTSAIAEPLARDAQSFEHPIKMEQLASPEIIMEIDGLQSVNSYNGSTVEKNDQLVNMDILSQSGHMGGLPCTDAVAVKALQVHQTSHITPTLPNNAQSTLASRPEEEKTIDQLALQLQISALQVKNTTLILAPSFMEHSTLEPKNQTSSTLAETGLLKAQQNPIMSCKRVFTDEMRIAAFQKGMKKQHKIHFYFNIPEQQFNLVHTWLGRLGSDSIQNIQSSICLSLGCYLTADLDELSKQENCDTIEKQVSHAHSIWPSGGNLIMNIHCDGIQQNLPLAPPLQSTPDNLVDISGFLVIGENHIELSQYEDLSQYTFVLHAHCPTPVQLQYWKEDNEKSRKWNNWMQHMSRPLDIGLSTFKNLPFVK